MGGSGFCVASRCSGMTVWFFGYARVCFSVCMCVQFCIWLSLEGMCSLSASEIHQEPLELDLNPQSQGSSGVCSKFFRRMVFSPLRRPPPLPLFSLFFFCSHLVNSTSTPVIFYCVEVISTLSVKWKHMMCRIRP